MSSRRLLGGGPPSPERIGGAAPEATRLPQPVVLPQAGRVVKTLSVFALCFALAAVEPVRVQPHLLPMADLLRHLDRDQEWLFLPLAEYHDLVAKGHSVPGPEVTGPRGAWVETARIRAKLHDTYIDIVADLVVVNTTTDTLRCPLFLTMPDQLSAPVFTDREGLAVLTAPRAQGGIDAVVPALARQQIRCVYRTRLHQDRAQLPLPQAVGLDVELTADRDGVCSGPGIVALGERRWTLSANRQNQLDLQWRPGLTAGTTAVWGLQQSVHIAIPDATADVLSWRWVARVDRRSGDAPSLLALRLPPTWVATQAVAGIHAIRTRADGVTELDIDASASELSLDGFCAGQAAIALPDIIDAQWQGGQVLLSNSRSRDWQIPAAWRPLTDTADGTIAYRVPGPGSELRWRASTSTRMLRETGEHRFAAGPRFWRLSSRLHIEAGDSNPFSLPLQLPPGWTLRGSTTSEGIAIKHEDGAASIVVTRGLQAHPSFTIDLVLERDRVAERFDVLLPILAEAGQRQHSVALLAAPGIDLDVHGTAPWRSQGQTDGSASLAEEFRAQLGILGEPVALSVHARDRAANCRAEAVIYLQPMDDRNPPGVWCRLDLRLDVRDGDMGDVWVDLPIVDGSERFSGQGLHLERRAGRLHLVSSQPWRGERLLRIEGRLIHPSGDRIVVPALTLRDEQGRALRTEISVAIQVPADLDVMHEANPDAEVGDEDDLPAWSRPLPGEPVITVWKLHGQSSGAITLVRRDLVEPPEGFIHDLHVRTQVSPSGVDTLYTFRVAAPQRSGLPLDLPSGMHLIAATIDGQPTALHQLGGREVMPLPGRTHVDVVLRCRQAAPDRRFIAALPGFDGLPVVGTTWTLAHDATWIAHSAVGPTTIALHAVDAPAHRRWWGAWQPAATRIDGMPRLGDTATAIDTDPRRLAANTDTVPDVTAPLPELTLVGHMLVGQRLGGDGVVHLDLTDLNRLRWYDRLGAALATLLAALVVWRQRTRTALVCGLAATGLALTLHHLGTTLGPCLACCEWLLPAILFILCLRAAGRLVLSSEATT